MRNLLRTTALAALLIAGTAVAQQSNSPDKQQPVGNANEAAQERSQNTPGAKGGTVEDAKGGAGNPAPAQAGGPPEAGPVPLRSDGSDAMRGNGLELPGATAQTAPAKFSEKNADLDEYSIMGLPVQLDDQQKHAIWQAVGGEQAKDTASAEGKTIFAEVGVFLPNNVDAQSLPDQLNAQIPQLRGLKYVKADDRVLLVAPANGIVRGVIEE
jgi:hypothetical protein